MIPGVGEPFIDSAEAPRDTLAMFKNEDVNNFNFFTCFTMDGKVSWWPTSIQ